jgi:hypothetical protein
MFGTNYHGTIEPKAAPNRAGQVIRLGRLTAASRPNGALAAVVPLMN